MSRRRQPSLRVTILSLGLIVVAGVVGLVATHRAGTPDLPPAPTSSTLDPGTTDARLWQLFQSQTSNVQVQGVGTVSRLLSDDNDGARHQRFILTLDSGQTLLIAHNIDLAPRLNGLAVGDRVGFNGEYIYSDQGGTVHWTHHDPAGTHVAGWLDWNGHRYS